MTSPDNSIGGIMMKMNDLPEIDHPENMQSYHFERGFESPGSLRNGDSSG
jgi:hypothetical protein